MKEKDRLHDIWRHMRRRCTSPTCYEYHAYGGRGIKIWSKWNSFPAFQKRALANGYADDLMLDRLDKTGNYTPSNCRWTTKAVNTNSKSTCRMITCPDGKVRSMSELARHVGLPVSTLIGRLKKNANPPYEWLTRPSESTRPVKIRKCRMLVKEQQCFERLLAAAESLPNASRKLKKAITDAKRLLAGT